MSTYLKVKIKTLAAESKIIRHEEKRLAKDSERRVGLRLHRINDVRHEARASLLAYGFLRGRTLIAIESKNHPDRPGPDWTKVERMIAKYGNIDSRHAKQTLQQWIYVAAGSREPRAGSAQTPSG